MMKNVSYKRTLLITSLLTLLPLVVGLLLWQKLPQTIATHFSMNDQANGWFSKPVAVVVPPCVLLLLQLFIFWCAKHSSQKNNSNFRIFNVTLWIIPLTSLVVNFYIYAIALGYHMSGALISSLLVGFVFIWVGNYLPKVKPNSATGFRLSWILNDKNNWQKTHRLAGWLFVIGGFVLLITSFMRIAWIILAVVLVIVLVPTIYSYWLAHKK